MGYEAGLGESESESGWMVESGEGRVVLFAVVLRLCIGAGWCSGERWTIAGHICMVGSVWAGEGRLERYIQTNVSIWRV